MDVTYVTAFLPLKKVRKTHLFPIIAEILSSRPPPPFSFLAVLCGVSLLIPGGCPAP
jgi:hypothetical protein